MPTNTAGEDLHSAIMNIPCNPIFALSADATLAYKLGHKDARHAAAELASAHQAVDNGGMTGWPPGMLQDDSRELSQALASKPDARMHAREAAEGWALVPKEPTREMMLAAFAVPLDEPDWLTKRYRAMLASSPQSPPVVEATPWTEMTPWMRDFLARGVSYVNTLYNGSPDEVPRSDTGAWIQVASQMLQRSHFAGMRCPDLVQTTRADQYAAALSSHPSPVAPDVEALTDEQILSVCYDAIGYDGGLQTVNEGDLLRLGRAFAQVHPVALSGDGSVGAASAAAPPVLDTLDAELNRILTMPEEQLDAEIRAEGGDPDDYAARGKAACERAIERAAEIIDARRWRWARANLLSMSFQSGPHKSSTESHSPIGDANTSAYWDRVADAAISQSTTIAEWKT